MFSFFWFATIVPHKGTYPLFKEKYVGVQSWKAAHLPTLEIRVKQTGNRVMKVERQKKLMRKKKW